MIYNTGKSLRTVYELNGQKHIFNLYIVGITITGKLIKHKILF